MLLIKPELTDGERRIITAALDLTGFNEVLEKVGQREVIKAMQRQQTALRDTAAWPEACRQAGKIETWEGLLQLLMSESRAKPGA